MRPIGTYKKYKSKGLDISKNKAPILVHTALLNRSYYKMIVYQSLAITLPVHLLDQYE